MARIIVFLAMLMLGIAAYLILRPENGQESAPAKAPSSERSSEEPDPRQPSFAVEENVERVDVSESSSSSTKALGLEDRPRKDTEFPVLVRYESGEVASGVPVNLEMVARADVVFRRVEEHQLTDDSGVAILEKRRVVRYVEGEVKSEIPVVVEIVCGIPLESPVSIEVTPELLDRGYGELTLPNLAKAWMKPLLVDVIDGEGMPVSDMSVDLMSGAIGSGSSDKKLHTQTTNAKGRVEFSLHYVWQQDRELSGIGVLSKTRKLAYFVVCDGPFKESIEAKVESQPPSQPLKLVLPDLAGIEVEVLDHHGHRVTSEGSVSLRWRVPNIASERTSFQRFKKGRQELVDGIAQFQPVGIDLEFSASAGVTDQSSSSGSSVFMGPGKAGHTTRVQVSLAPPRPIVQGRVVDSLGEPMRNHYLVIEIWELPKEGPKYETRPRPSWQTLSTDENGRFEMRVSAKVDGTINRHIRFLEKSSPGGKFAEESRWAKVDIPSLLSPGERFEVGDVIMERIPILVAGRVVDVQGNPLPQAYVNLQLPHGPDDGRQWTNEYGNVPADEEGRFEIRYPGDWELVKLWGRISPHYYGKTTPIRAGHQNAILVLEDTRREKQDRGQIAGRLILSEEIPFTAMHVTIRSERNRRDREVGPFGFFGLDDAYPEEVSLEAQIQSTDWVIDRIDGVLVESGKKVEDSRITAWDLRGKIRSLALTVQTVDERRLVNTRVSLRNREGKGGWLKTDSRGRLVVFLPQRENQYELSAPGFGSGRFAWNEPDGTVVRLESDK